MNTGHGTKFSSYQFTMIMRITVMLKRALLKFK